MIAAVPPGLMGAGSTGAALLPPAIAMTPKPTPQPTPPPEPSREAQVVTSQPQHTEARGGSSPSVLRRGRSRTDHTVGFRTDVAAQSRAIQAEAGAKDRAARAAEIEALLERAVPKDAWENRLAEAWRGTDGGAEVRRRAELLARAPVFQDCSNKELRMLGVAMEQMSYGSGEVLFAEGDAPNGVYVLESGACAVHVKGVGVVRDLNEPGAIFGELSIFLDSNRTASVVATAPTLCLRCSGGDAIKVMEQTWGDRAELENRADMLAKVDLLSDLGKANLMMLATAVNEHIFHRPGVDIIREGQRGENLFVVKVGNPTVHVRGVGRVRELAPGDFFGEMVVLGGNPYRTATVTTADMRTVVYTLHQNDLYRLTTREQQKIMLAKHGDLCNARVVLRQSAACLECIDRFWQVLRTLTEQEASKAQEGNTGRRRWLVAKRAVAFGNRGAIDKNAYVEMHCRISRVLARADDFDLEAAQKLAEKDWYEDMTLGANNIRVALWVEKAKEKLLKVLGTTVARIGLVELFKRIDTDGCGKLDFNKFDHAVRVCMKIPTRLMLVAHLSLGAAGRHLVNKKNMSIEADELKEIFMDVDRDGDGSVSAKELVEYLVSKVPSTEVKGTTREQKSASQRRRDLKLLIQEACREEVDQIGWMNLFSEFDADGSGHLDLAEFTTVIRKYAKVGKKLVSDENIESLFRAIDANGRIDSKKLQSFLSERPFEKSMPYDTFVESMFQLAQSWVEDKRTAELIKSCNSDEEKYATVFSFLLDKITTPTGKLKTLQQRLGGFNPNGNFELVDDGDAAKALEISGAQQKTFGNAQNFLTPAGSPAATASTRKAAHAVRAKGTAPQDSSAEEAAEPRTAWVDRATGGTESENNATGTIQTIVESDNSSGSGGHIEPRADDVWQLDTASVSAKPGPVLHADVITADIAVGTGVLRAQARLQRVYVPVCTSAWLPEESPSSDSNEGRSEGETCNRPQTASLVPSLASSAHAKWKQQIQRRSQRPLSARATIANRFAGVVTDGSEAQFHVSPAPPADLKKLSSNTSPRQRQQQTTRQQKQQQKRSLCAQTRRNRPASAGARTRRPNTWRQATTSPGGSLGSRAASSGVALVSGVAGVAVQTRNRDVQQPHWTQACSPRHYKTSWATSARTVQTRAASLCSATHLQLPDSYSPLCIDCTPIARGPSAFECKLASKTVSTERHKALIGRAS